jgi:hypothetical protein
MPSAPVVEHIDSAKYWGAAPIAHSKDDQLPGFGTYVPPVLDWGLLPTPADIARLSERGRHEDIVETPPIDEAAEAQEAREKGAWQMGRRGRRRSQYEGYTAPPAHPDDDNFDLSERPSTLLDARPVPQAPTSDAKVNVPTWREQFAGAVTKPGMSYQRAKLVEGLLGTLGAKAPGVSIGLVDFVPFLGTVLGVQEALQHGDLESAALAILPGGKAAAPPVKTAKEILQAGRATMPVPAHAPRAPSSPPLASKELVIYDPPPQRPRPFEKDYPEGAPTDGEGRLLKTLEGEPITGRWVVGRKVVGGNDQPFPQAELNALAEATTGRRPESVSARETERDFGRTTIDPDTGQPGRVLLRSDMPPDKAVKVLAHELGHVINQSVGDVVKAPHRSIPYEESLVPQLKKIYNTLNNPKRMPDGLNAAKDAKWVTPENFGYRDHEVPLEYWSEAVRAYLTDPNYIKTIAPNVAKAIRNAVNSHPTLSKIIQFNTIAGIGIAPQLFADDAVADETSKR